ncbi:hypothetical protein V8F20_008675 [Naviculisporaceae sp. PSN 640]
MTCESHQITLHEDILRCIFGFVEDDRPTEDGFANCHRDEDSVRTLQNLRLTCRHFYEIASPLLVPRIKVGYTESSLKNLEMISTHPLISQGVRVVQVVLNSFRADRSHAWQEDTARRITLELGTTWSLVELLATQETSWEEHLRCEPRLRRARILFNTLTYLYLDELARYRDGQGRIRITKENILKPPNNYLVQVKSDMDRAWSSYCDCVTVQKKLCEQASSFGVSVFACRIASAIAQMSGKRRRTIEFLDTHRTETRGPLVQSMSEFLREDADLSRCDFELFYEPFVRATPMATRQSPWDPSLYNPLLDLPVALQGAKAQNIEGISVDLLGMPATNQLRAAKLFEALRFLKIKSFSFRTRSALLDLSIQRTLRTFLAVPTLDGILIDSPRLRRLGEDSYTIQVPGGLHNSLRQFMLALARRITAAADVGITTSDNNSDACNWRYDEVLDPNTRINCNLRRVHLRGGTFKLKDLREFLRTLPRGVLDEFTIDQMRLLRDEEEVPQHPEESRINVAGTWSWEKALDVLREGLTVRQPQGLRLRRVCTWRSTNWKSPDAVGLDRIVFSKIWGNEDLDYIYPPFYDEWDDWNKMVQGPLSCAEKYVTRLEEANPIRIFRELEESKRK